MEQYIQHIEYINQYISNSLSDKERQAFHQQLTTDSDFKEVYEDHLAFLGGIQRVALKQEIQTARKEYIKAKWIKYISIGIGVIGLSALVYSLFFAQAKTPTITNRTTQESVTQIEFIGNNTDTITTKAIKASAKHINTPTLVQTDTTTIKTKTTLKQFNTSISSQEETTVLTTLNQGNGLEQFYNTVKKSPQTFLINTLKDTVIKCKEGTILRLKANSFVNKKTGDVLKGEARLEVTEYYTLSDILLGNLSTKSDDRLLETGGMLFLKAYSSENLLELNKKMTIEIPVENKKEDMQLFMGQETQQGINWIINTSEDIEEITNIPFAIIDEVPSYPECQNMTNEDTKICVSKVFQRIINRHFNSDLFQDFSTGNILRIFTSFTIDTNGDIINITSRPDFPGIQEEVERVLALMPRLSPGRQRGRVANVLYSLPITIRLDVTESNRSRNQTNRDSVSYKNTITKQPTIVYDTIFYGGRTTIEDIKEILHNNNADVDSTFIDRYQNYKKKRLIQERKINGEPYVFIRKAILEDPNSGFTILPTDSITRGGNVIRKRWNNTQIPDRQFARLIPRQPNATNYLFTASRLGWINCDRFIRNKGPKIKYKIKIKDSNGADVKMVFKNRRSILQGRAIFDSFNFGDIPKGEDVTLVAIKVIDNQYQLAIKDVNTENLKEFEFDFKEYTFEDIQQELKKLNPSF